MSASYSVWILGIILSMSLYCAFVMWVYLLFTAKASKSDFYNGCLVWGHVPKA